VGLHAHGTLHAIEPRDRCGGIVLWRSASEGHLGKKCTPSAPREYHRPGLLGDGQRASLANCTVRSLGVAEARSWLHAGRETE